MKRVRVNGDLTVELGANGAVAWQPPKLSLAQVLEAAEAEKFAVYFEYCERSQEIDRVIELLNRAHEDLEPSR